MTTIKCEAKKLNSRCGVTESLLARDKEIRALVEINR